MSGRIGYHVVTDELCFLVGLDVVLIDVERHLVFLGSRLIGTSRSFWRSVELGFPCFMDFALFDLHVLLPSVALPWYFNKARINNLPGFGKDTLVVQGLIEPIKPGLIMSTWIRVSRNFQMVLLSGTLSLDLSPRNR
jgi:hypothetical protein